MVKIIILRYIFAEKICNKETSNLIIACILLSALLFATTSNIKNPIFIMVLMCLILLSMIMKEYETISQGEYVTTPLMIVEKKYSEILTRKSLIDFLGINDKERIELKEMLDEYEDAIDLLVGEGKNED